MSGADSGARVKFAGVSFQGKFGQEQFDARNLYVGYMKLTSFSQI